MADEKLDPKYLEGLKYKTADVKTKKNDSGRETVVHSAVEEALSHKHILGWKDYGSHVHIVTRDGRKHKVAKDKKGAK